MGATPLTCADEIFGTRSRGPTANCPVPRTLFSAPGSRAREKACQVQVMLAGAVSEPVSVAVNPMLVSELPRVMVPL